MAFEIRMPKMGLTMSTAQVGRWLKKEGDPIKRGEPVVEVMTDKLTNKLEAGADGLLLRISAKEGDSLEAGGLLGFIGQPGEALPEAPGTMAAPAAAPWPSSPM